MSGAKNCASTLRSRTKQCTHCRGCHLRGALGGGRGSICVGNAIDRAPLFPTARTAKKWLSVETPFSVVFPAAATKPYTCQRGSVVSRHRISNPARSESSAAVQERFASGVAAPESGIAAGAAGASASSRRASALSRATSPRNLKSRYSGSRRTPRRSRRAVSGAHGDSPPAAR